jgi:hypothetical protein
MTNRREATCSGKHHPEIRPHLGDLFGRRCTGAKKASSLIAEILLDLDHINPDQIDRLHYLASQIVPLDDEGYSDCLFEMGTHPRNYPERNQENLQRKEEQPEEVKGSGQSRTELPKEIFPPLLFWRNIWTLFRPDFAILGEGAAQDLFKTAASQSVYCQSECSNCHFEFIGPFGMPEITEWAKLGSCS